MRAALDPLRSRRHRSAADVVAGGGLDVLVLLIALRALACAATAAATAPATAPARAGRLFDGGFPDVVRFGNAVLERPRPW